LIAIFFCSPEVKIKGARILSARLSLRGMFQMPSEAGIAGGDGFVEGVCVGAGFATECPIDVAQDFVAHGVSGLWGLAGQFTYT
jgi:hypothetical protein